MEEIRTDNTETLKNALERIKELEKENAELKEIVTKMNNVIIGTFSNLTKAKEVIKKFSEFVNNIQNIICGTSFVNQAEQFLKDIKEG